MKSVVAISGALLGFLLGCTKGVVGGNPTLPLSDTNGTSQVFEASDSEVTRAISNAFQEDLRYGFSDAVGYSRPDKGWHPTNGFVLTADRATTSIPLNTGVSVPYYPYFHIFLTQLNAMRTKVTVRTVSATVLDGQEVGVHGGWANHHREVPPVRSEETNVLSAIAAQLKSEKQKSPIGK